MVAKGKAGAGESAPVAPAPAEGSGTFAPPCVGEALPSLPSLEPDRVALLSVRADGEPDHPSGVELLDTDAER
jgi:hypothetical protein